MIQKGSIKLFTLMGAPVTIHWSWLIVLYFVLKYRAPLYSNNLWVAIDLLTFMLIVLAEEIALAGAVRFAGGKVYAIKVEFLGSGSHAFIPQRPGAVMLAHLGRPVLMLALTTASMILYWWMRTRPGAPLPVDVERYLEVLRLICVVLLIWSIVPVYPQDGGQILRALLWFVMGPAWSLLVVCIVGIIGVIFIAALAVILKSILWGIAAFFIGWACVRGFSQFKELRRLEALPRHGHAKCPHCANAAPIGLVQCGSCLVGFDPFEHRGVCPHCQVREETIACAYCGQMSMLAAWMEPVGAFPVTVKTEQK